MALSKRKLAKLSSSVNGIVIECLRSTKQKFEPDWWDDSPDAWSREQTEQWDRLFELAHRIINEVEQL